VSQRRAAGARELPSAVERSTYDERAGSDASHAAGGVSRVGRTLPTMDRLRRGLLAGDRLRAVSRRSLWALPFLAANSLFTDLAAITFNVAVGPPWAPPLHWLVLAPWACLVLWALYHHILPDSVAAWLEAREERLLQGRARRLLRWGKPMVVVILGASVGPLSALLAIRMFGIPSPRRYLLAMGATAAYCVVWTGVVYGGGWVLLRHLLTALGH
jgi:hypothetical protein